MTSAEIGSIDPDDLERRHRRRLQLTAVAGVVLLVLLCSFIWPFSNGRFIPPPVGSYSGVVSLGDDGEARTEHELYLEVSPAGLFIAPLEAGWAVQEYLETNDSPLREVVLRTEGAELRLLGGGRRNGEYQGEALDELRGLSGTWRLQSVAAKRGVDLSEHDLHLWLSLAEEGLRVDELIDEASTRAPQIKEEIEKLTAFISERGELKARADQKLQKISEELQHSRDRLAEKRKEAKRLEQKIDLALKVLPMGRLVRLSRETLEREGRWIQSYRGASDVEGSPELLAAVERAQQIKELQRQIRLRKIELSRPVSDGTSIAPSEDPEL